VAERTDALGHHWPILPAQDAAGPSATSDLPDARPTTTHFGNALQSDSNLGRHSKVGHLAVAKSHIAHETKPR